MTAEMGGASTDPTDNSLLGTGHGVDHVILLTKDLRVAVRDFRDQLGFTPTLGSRFPSGMENAAIRLKDRKYLELIAPYDRSTGHPEVQEIETFLSRGEGAATVGIRVSSIEGTARYLRERKIPFLGPSDLSTIYPGIAETPPVFWRFVALKTGRPDVDERIFFTQTVEGAYRAFRARHPELPDFDSLPSNPNGAEAGLHAYLATSDVTATAAAYEALGFPRRREVHWDRMEAEGFEFGVGTGSLVVLGSTAPDGPVAAFLDRRRTSDGVLGVSLGVRDLGAARGAMGREIVPHVEAGRGPFGRNLLVPPDLAHGVWLELFVPDTSPATQTPP